MADLINPTEQQNTGQQAEPQIDYDALIKSAFNVDTDNTDLNYDYNDEEKSRRIAERDLGSERIRSMANSSKQNADAVSKIIGQVKKDYEAKLAKVEAKLNDFESYKQLANSKLNKFDEKYITEQISKEENEIINDPIIGKHYNAAEVQKHLFDQASKGRALSPYEMHAIIDYWRVASRLDELEKANSNKRELMNAPLFSRPKIDDDLDRRLSGVKTEEEAMRVLYRDLENKYS